MQLLADVEKTVREKYKDGNQHRLNHIIGVVKMAGLLATKYGVDKDKAMIAAWMHDYSKYDDFSDADKYLTAEDILECQKYPFLFHAYLSAEHYKRLGGADNEIYLAIRNHVFGRPGMTRLEEIVMISDYTEENREYPTCIKCREILLGGDLYGAIVYSLEKTMEHVRTQNEEPHPRQMMVYNEYKRRLEK